MVEEDMEHVRERGQGIVPQGSKIEIRWNSKVGVTNCFVFWGVRDSGIWDPRLEEEGICARRCKGVIESRLPFLVYYFLVQQSVFVVIVLVVFFFHICRYVFVVFLMCLFSSAVFGFGLSCQLSVEGIL